MKAATFAFRIVQTPRNMTVLEKSVGPNSAFKSFCIEVDRFARVTSKKTAPKPFVLPDNNNKVLLNQTARLLLMNFANRCKPIQGSVQVVYCQYRWHSLCFPGMGPPQKRHEHPIVTMPKRHQEHKKSFKTSVKFWLGNLDSNQALTKSQSALVPRWF